MHLAEFSQENGRGIQKLSITGPEGLCYLWEAGVMCVLGCTNIPTEWLCFPFAGGARGRVLPTQGKFLHSFPGSRFSEPHS